MVHVSLPSLELRTKNIQNYYCCAYAFMKFKSE